MTRRPPPWFQEDDFDSDPSSHLIPSSGRESPHERRHMPPGEAVQSMRPAYVFDNVETLSSDGSPAHSQSYDSMPPSPRQNPLAEFPQKSTPEGGTRHSQFSRYASYNGVPPSPLNPAITSVPHTLSPFSRSGLCGSAQIMRVPSEECRALSSGSPSSTNPSHTRGSMILYRKAESQDNLSPPQFPHSKRNSMISTDSFPLSSDSKYPVGAMMSEHGLVAYAWDPLEDDATDEEDKLHDFDWKTTYDSERSLSLRGFINIAALILLLSALLCLFVMYPVYRSLNDNGRGALIVGNTRINSTGQASSVEFDPRSKVLSLPSSVGLDPTTPQEALIRRSQDGALYRLVFSDEFNTDGRSFYKDDDPFWEAVDYQVHDQGLITTHNGYLGLTPHIVSARSPRIGVQTGGVLKQRTSSCLDGGFIEVSIASPSSSQNKHLMWTGSWIRTDAGVPTQGVSLSELVSLKLIFNSGTAETMAIDFVRYYQRVGSSPRSCDNTTLQTLEFPRDIL